MNEKQTLAEFDAAFKKLKARKKLTHREYWVIAELDRLTHIMRGEDDPGPMVGVTLVQRASSVSRPTISTWRNIGFPETMHGFAVPVEALVVWMRRQWLKAQTRGVSGEGGDPLMVGGDGSPALERYREARASLENLRWERETSKVVEREEAINDMYQLLTSLWNQIGLWVDRLPPVLRMKKAPAIRKRLFTEKNRLGRSIISKMEKLAKDREAAEAKAMEDAIAGDITK